MEIDDKALEAAAEAFYDAGENENWTWETETQENKEYVLKATKAAIEAYEKAKWQPIETAPKDGTDILIINDSKGTPETGGTYPFEIGVAQWSYGAYGDNIENYKWRSSYCANLKTYFTPSHWMSLPQPPEQIDG